MPGFSFAACNPEFKIYACHRRRRWRALLRSGRQPRTAYPASVYQTCRQMPNHTLISGRLSLFYRFSSTQRNKLTASPRWREDRKRRFYEKKLRKKQREKRTERGKKYKSQGDIAKATLHSNERSPMRNAVWVNVLNVKLGLGKGKGKKREEERVQGPLFDTFTSSVSNFIFIYSFSHFALLSCPFLFSSLPLFRLPGETSEGVFVGAAVVDF